MQTMTSRWRLDDQTALITGASQGIGRATACELAALGAEVLLVARNPDVLEQTREELAEVCPHSRPRSFTGDLSNAEVRFELFDWIADLGVSLSLLVNNVGGNVVKPCLDYDHAEVAELLEVNLLSAFEISRLAHPHLAVHGHAAIVNIGSVSGMTHVRTGAPYGMSKAALHQLTRNLACEWATDGIRVNAVAPWYIRTRRTGPDLADSDYLGEVLEHTPIDRIGEPEEVAAAVAFLCLPAAGYITGQVLAVDGGFLAHGF